MIQKIEKDLSDKEKIYEKTVIGPDGKSVVEIHHVKLVSLDLEEYCALMKGIDEGTAAIEVLKERYSFWNSLRDIEKIDVVKEKNRFGKETGNVVVPEKEYRKLVATATAVEDLDKRERQITRREVGVREEKEQMIREQKMINETVNAKVEKMLEPIKRIMQSITSAIEPGHSLWDDIRAFINDKKKKKIDLNREIDVAKMEAAYRKMYGAQEEMQQEKDSNRGARDDEYIR